MLTLFVEMSDGRSRGDEASSIGHYSSRGEELSEWE